MRRLPLVFGGTVIGVAPAQAIRSTRAVPGFAGAFGFRLGPGRVTSPTCRLASSAARSPDHAARWTSTWYGQGVAATSAATCAA